MEAGGSEVDIRKSGKKMDEVRMTKANVISNSEQLIANYFPKMMARANKYTAVSPTLKDDVKGRNPSID